MSSGTQPTARATTSASSELWRDHARVFLQPIAAPSILGRYGFAVATFMVTAHQVGWYGTASTPLWVGVGFLGAFYLVGGIGWEKVEGT